MNTDNRVLMGEPPEKVVQEEPKRPASRTAEILKSQLQDLQGSSVAVLINDAVYDNDHAKEMAQSVKRRIDELITDLWTLI